MGEEPPTTLPIADRYARARSLWNDFGSRRHTVAAICATIALAVLISAGDAIRHKNRNDLYAYSLEASMIILRGDDPYSDVAMDRNYKYLPLNALLLAPLTPLPRPIAQGIFTAIGFLLLYYCIRLHGVYLDETGVDRWVWLLALGFAIRYIFKNSSLGQWNTSVYCLSFIGLTLSFKRPIVGGFIVALSAAMKYLPAFFLLFFLLRRRWRAAAAMAIGIIFWVLIFPSIALGPRRHMELLKSYREQARTKLGQMRGEENTVAGISVRTEILMLLSPVVHSTSTTNYRKNVLNLDRERAGKVADAIVVVPFLALLVLTFFSGRRRSDAGEASGDAAPRAARIDDLLLIGLWYLLFLIISPNVRTSYLLYLFTPIFALGAHSCLAWSASALPRYRRFALAVGALTLLLYIASINFSDAIPTDIWVAHYGGYAMIILLLAFLSFVALAIGHRVGSAMPGTIH